MKQDLWKYSAYELIQMYKNRKTSPLEVVHSVLDQINKCNDILKAFVSLDHDLSLKQAKASLTRWTSGKTKGLLDGVPISIKDLLITKDYPTKRGSLTTSLPVESKVDAPVVQKIRENGGIILGKTATPEFGHKGTTQSRAFGNTLNPWNKEFNAGGSSGGSCSAVASGMGPLSVGTDGGGSIRIPCSFCGLFGHKPTFGKVPAFPISPFGTLANIGPISRTVKDSKLLMNIIAKPHQKDWHSLPDDEVNYLQYNLHEVKSLKVAFVNDWGMSKNIKRFKVEEDVETKIHDAKLKIQSEIKGDLINLKIEWPHDPEKIFKTLWYFGAANLFKKIKQQDQLNVEENFKKFSSLGKICTSFDIFEAEEKRAENAIYLKSLFEEFDLLIGATLPVTSFNTNNLVPSGWDEQDIFCWTPYTYPFNLTKNPSSTVNCNFTKTLLPVGIQIVGPTYKDKICLDYAQFLEDIFSLTNAWPNLNQ